MLREWRHWRAAQTLFKDANNKQLTLQQRQERVGKYLEASVWQSSAPVEHYVPFSPAGVSSALVAPSSAVLPAAVASRRVGGAAALRSAVAVAEVPIGAFDLASPSPDSAAVLVEAEEEKAEVQQQPRLRRTASSSSSSGSRKQKGSSAAAAAELALSSRSSRSSYPSSRSSRNRAAKASDSEPDVAAAEEEDAPLLPQAAPASSVAPAPQQRAVVAAEPSSDVAVVENEVDSSVFAPFLRVLCCLSRKISSVIGFYPVPSPSARQPFFDLSLVLPFVACAWVCCAWVWLACWAVGGVGINTRGWITNVAIAIAAGIEHSLTSISVAGIERGKGSLDVW